MLVHRSDGRCFRYRFFVVYEVVYDAGELMRSCGAGLRIAELLKKCKDVAEKSAVRPAAGITVWEFGHLAKAVGSREPLPAGRDRGRSNPPNALRPCWSRVALVWWSASAQAGWELRT